MIGFSSFLVKKYTPEELGINLKLGGEKVKQLRHLIFGPLFFRLIQYVFFPLDKAFELHATDNYTIQRRQYYLFIWGIPIFPVNKYWCIRLENKKQYELPVSAKTIIESLPKKFKIAPWYSFIGAMGIFLTISIYIGNHLYRQHSISKKNREEFNNEVALLKAKLHSPLKGDFYVFDVYRNKGEWAADSAYSSRTTVFKLKEVRSDSLNLVTVFNILDENWNGHFYYIHECEEAFNDSVEIKKSCWVRQKDLQTLISENYISDRRDSRIIFAIDPGLNIQLVRIFREGEQN